MRKLLILTGPQGSGNHLFSKCLALHEDVFGWKSLLNTYWEGHHLEPFAEYWEDPSKLADFDWSQSDYYVTSISSPYTRDQQLVAPNYIKFIEHASKYVEQVDVAIIGRDQTILKYQQERVRKQYTTPQALESFRWLLENQDCTFISQELLQLYKTSYLAQLANQLDWPIAHWDPEVDAIIANDSNVKYIKETHEYWLDFEVHRAVRESKH